MPLETSFSYYHHHHHHHNNLTTTLTQTQTMPQSTPTTTTTSLNRNKNLAPDNSNSSNMERYEIKSGKLLLQHRLGSKSAWLPVFVRVYKNTFEHFAVVSRDQAISVHSTYVNLRSSTCTDFEDSPSGFKVIQNNYEGTVITFDAGNKAVVSDWVDAFTCTTPPCSPTQGRVSSTLSPAIPRSPMMPSLPEVDEEE